MENVEERNVAIEQMDPRVQKLAVAERQDPLLNPRFVKEWLVRPDESARKEFEQWRERRKQLGYRIPLIERLRVFLLTKKVGLALDLFQIFLSGVSFAFYIYGSYLTEEALEGGRGGLPIYLVYPDFALTILFLIDFLLHLFLAERQIRFLLSVHALVDVITIVPALLGFSFDVNMRRWFGYIRLIRIIRLLRENDFFLTFDSDVAADIINLAVTSASLIIVSAGLVGAIEDIVFHEAIYFIVVTFSTVGYGDLSPKSDLGRVTVMILIVIAIILIPLQTKQLLNSLSTKSAYSGSFSLPRSLKEHVIIAGNASGHVISDFLGDFFHVKRKLRTFRYGVAILSPDEPDAELLALMKSSSALLQRRVKYFVGSAVNKNDLERVNAADAKAIFMLTDRFSSDWSRADSKTTLRSLAVRRYFGETPLYVQVLSPRNSSHLMAAGVGHVVCLQEMKMNVLARSCTAPGFSTLVAGLLKATVPAYEQDDPLWIQEYLEGAGHEIYPVRIPPLLSGVAFCSGARFLYMKFSLTLFAMALPLKSGELYIALNPAERRLSHGDVGFVVAMNQSHANLVDTFRYAEKDFDELHAARFNESLGKKGSEPGENPFTSPSDWTWRYDIRTAQFRCFLQSRPDPNVRRVQQPNALNSDLSSSGSSESEGDDVESESFSSYVSETDASSSIHSYDVDSEGESPHRHPPQTPSVARRRGAGRRSRYHHRHHRNMVRVGARREKKTIEGVIATILDQQEILRQAAVENAERLQELRRESNATGSVSELKVGNEQGASTTEPQGRSSLGGAIDAAERAGDLVDTKSDERAKSSVTSIVPERPAASVSEASGAGRLVVVPEEVEDMSEAAVPEVVLKDAAEAEADVHVEVEMPDLPAELLAGLNEESTPNEPLAIEMPEIPEQFEGEVVEDPFALRGGETEKAPTTGLSVVIPGESSTADPTDSKAQSRTLAAMTSFPDLAHRPRSDRSTLKSSSTIARLRHPMVGAGMLAHSLSRDRRSGSIHSSERNERHRAASRQSESDRMSATVTGPSIKGAGLDYVASPRTVKRRATLVRASSVLPSQLLVGPDPSKSARKLALSVPYGPKENPFNPHAAVARKYRAQLEVRAIRRTKETEKLKGVDREGNPVARESGDHGRHVRIESKGEVKSSSSSAAPSSPSESSSSEEESSPEEESATATKTSKTSKTSKSAKTSRTTKTSGTTEASNTTKSESSGEILEERQSRDSGKAAGRGVESSSTLSALTRSAREATSPMTGVDPSAGTSSAKRETAAENYRFTSPRNPARSSARFSRKETAIRPTVEGLEALEALPEAAPKKNKVLLKHGRPLEHAILPTAENFSEHIIVCGEVSCSSLRYFITPLRSVHLERFLPVVILTNHQFDSAGWREISRLPEVWIVRGTPTSFAALKRAGLRTCSVCVVMAGDSVDADVEEPLVDAQSVMALLAIETFGENLKFSIVDLVYPSNMKFLVTKNALLDSVEELDYWRSSYFACGRVFSDSALQSLLSQAFFNPYVVNIIHQLATSGEGLEDHDAEGIAGVSHLYQVDVPVDFVGSVYLHLFQFMTYNKVLPLALYRTSPDLPFRFVYTNPSPQAIVRANDRSFLLASKDCHDKFIDVCAERAQLADSGLTIGAISKSVASKRRALSRVFSPTKRTVGTLQEKSEPLLSKSPSASMTGRPSTKNGKGKFD